jgi:ketosteroid isomerase-like protein
MLRRHHLFGGTVLGLLALGCARTTPAVDAAADEQAINAVRGREVAAFSAGSVDSVLAVLTSDAVLMPPNEPMRTGPEAIRTWLQNIASQFSVDARYTDVQVSVAGDWGIERYVGVLRLTPKTSGPVVEERVKGIHIYRRQADGSWRIAQDVWNSDGPPPASAAFERGVRQGLNPGDALDDAALVASLRDTP